MRLFLIAFLLLGMLNVLSAQQLKLSVDYTYGRVDTRHPEPSTFTRNAFAEATPVAPSALHAVGVRGSFAFNKLVVSARVAYQTQAYRYDSIAYSAPFITGYWTSLDVQLNRLLFQFGLGTELRAGKFYCAPEVSVFAATVTTFDVDETFTFVRQVNDPPRPTRFERGGEFGVQFGAEFGYYLTDHLTLGVRPGYYISEYELQYNTARSADNSFTDTFFRGWTVGLYTGYAF